MKGYYLGIDQGTTGVTAILFDEFWRQSGRGYWELQQIYPQPGWVEHDALQIWDAVCRAVSQSMMEAGAMPSQIRCIGLDHEGESIVMWDKNTGVPISNAIVWQDRRTAWDAEQVSARIGDLIRQRTGLMVDSYFSALKIRWILEHVPEAKALLAQNRLLCGTMDTWLVWKMTKGAVHATDTSTASRTMLLNLETGDWDPDILTALDIPRDILPRICPSAMVYGTAADLCGINAPITGILTDQQAALFGQTCFDAGSVKTTYGTGCFMLMNTGDKPVFSSNGLLTTVAWRIGNRTSYALDGGIYTSGAAVQWLRDGLKIIRSASETEAMALRAGDNGGVYFVPAFTGLAAPCWDTYARGMMIGITGGTTREQIVRATLESTAYQVCDMLNLMQQDSGVPIREMRCDGGAVENRFLMQFQADLLGIPVHIPLVSDATALGAAFMAALGAGLWNSEENLRQYWHLRCCYEPAMGTDQREALLYHWHRAVERARDWARS